MQGLIVVDKPLGLSSMDVVRRVRRAAKRGLANVPPPPGQTHPKRIKCGHAGTLDPLATGVVVCGIGKATKLMDAVMGQTKVYKAGVDLSAFTASDDAEADREPVDVPVPPSRDAVTDACATFVGTIQQVPPAYSALHVDGERAYKLVRRGETVELPPRPVTIHAIELLDYAWPHASLRLTTGKGVYIRSVARDLGRALGTGGYLTALRRTAVGNFTLDRAHAIERFEQPLLPDDLIAIPAD